MDQVTVTAGEVRKDGWTWAKEIIGTIIGATAVAVPLVLGMAQWMNAMDRQTALNTAEIIHLKQNADADRQTARDDRGETNRKLDKLLDAVAILQQQMARTNARTGDRDGR